MAYLLSAVAALIYIVAAVGLARAGTPAAGWPLACCSVELVGVVAVGILSLADRELFPDETVWSGFGSGYGYIPLVLPVLGLLWLSRTRRRHRRRPERRTAAPRVSPAGRRRRR